MSSIKREIRASFIEMIRLRFRALFDLIASDQRSEIADG
ncbi:hypothetical protein CEV32_2765 [Brucella rhizosphaerae]|uniref:Uncharacterized protein n=1 Tax=Brucella rhizosphaerae TaxID=571254 RepID=A0A256EZL3_9HYPH|nr:hypothetical protein CEV32_2765 [Brucella rhizosphaerae]